MTLSITCSNCGRQFSRIKPELAGKKVRCACGTSLRLPLGESEFEATPAVQLDPQANRPRPQQASRPSDPFEFHYSDLDDILARPEALDLEFDPASEHSNTTRSGLRQTHPAPAAAVGNARPVSTVAGSNSAAKGTDPPRATNTAGGLLAVQPATVPTSIQPVEIPDRKNQTTSRRLVLVVALALMSALISLGLAMFLLSARLSTVNLIWTGQAELALRQINSGQFELDPTSGNVKLGFQVIGWLILVVAVLLIGLAILQMLGAGLQLFTHLSILRWVDGLLATLAVILLFLLIGALFLHGTHIQQLVRQINQASVVVETEEPPNIQRLRAQYRDQADDFRWGMVTLSLAPATLFGCSMLRLLVPLPEP